MLPPVAAAPCGRPPAATALAATAQPAFAESRAGSKGQSLLLRLWSRARATDAEARGLLKKLKGKKVLRGAGEQAGALVALWLRGLWREALELAGALVGEEGLGGEELQGAVHSLHVAWEELEEEVDLGLCVKALGSWAQSGQWELAASLLGELARREGGELEEEEEVERGRATGSRATGSRAKPALPDPRAGPAAGAAEPARSGSRHGRAMADFARGQQWQEVLHLLHKVKQKIPGPELSVHNAAISACGRCRRWAWALQLLADLWSEGHRRPDIVSISAAVAACGQAQHWQEALALLGTARTWGLELDVIACGAAIRACERSLQWQAALRLLLGLAPSGLQPNVVVYTSAVSACAKAEQAGPAFWLLEHMRSSRCEATGSTYSALIGAAEEQQQWRWASAVLEKLRGWHQAPDGATCNAAISAFARGRLWERALGCLAELRAVQGTPDAIGFSAACSACERGRQPDIALGLLAEMWRESCLPDAVTYNSAISACGSTSRWEEAAQLLAELPLRTLEPDAVGFSASAAGCERSTPSEWRQVLLLLHAARRCSLRADAGFANTAAGSCNKVGQWRAATQALAAMCDAGLRQEPHQELRARTAALVACQQTGRWQEAVGLLALEASDAPPADTLSLAAALQSFAGDDRSGLAPARRVAVALRQTVLQSEPDAGVMVVAMDSLAGRVGAVDGEAEAVFRRRVYGHVLLRLQSLRHSERREQGSHGQLRDPILERQFGLGPASPRVLGELSLQGSFGAARADAARLALRRAQVWVQEGLYRVEIPSTVVAKFIPAWTSCGSAGRLPTERLADGLQQSSGTQGRIIGFANVAGTGALPPVFIEHDRSQHAERQALLSLMQGAAADGAPAAQAVRCGSATWLYVCAAPCMSCLAVSCQFAAALGRRPLHVVFDSWGENLRWVTVELPEEGEHGGEKEEVLDWARHLGEWG